MALRLFLVGIVTSMGMSLPTSNDLNRWTTTSRSWLARQIAATPSPMPTDFRAFATELPAPREVHSDVAAPEVKVSFELVGPPRLEAELVLEESCFEKTLNAIIADFHEGDAVALTSSELIVPVIDDFELAVMLDEGLAVALNKASEGLGPIAIPSGYARDRPELTTKQVADASETMHESQLIVAVRLTGQAAGAWMSLIRQGPAILTISR